MILADPVTTGGDLKSGALVRLVESVDPDKGSYVVVVPNERLGNPLVQALLDWLVGHPVSWPRPARRAAGCSRRG